MIVISLFRFFNHLVIYCVCANHGKNVSKIIVLLIVATIMKFTIACEQEGQI